MKNIFYADSGATDHMTFQRELLKNFREFSTSACQVKVSDGGRLDVCVIGDIEVYAIDQEKFIHTIKDVLLVPELDRNFLSVSRITEKGMRNVFEEGAKRVCLIKSDRVIIDGMRENRLYRMNIVPTLNATLNAAQTESFML